MTLSKRNTGFRNVESAWLHLKNFEAKLLCSKSLSDYQLKRLKEVSAKTNRRHNKRRIFLESVGDAYRPLCTIAFTQNQVEFTKLEVLEALAVKTKSQDEICLSVPSLLRGSKERDPPIDCATVGPGTDLSEPDISLDIWPPLLDDTWFEVNQAEKDGTKRVFGEAVYNKIQTLQEVGGEYKAVTMRFLRTPSSSSSRCRLRLDIREEYMTEIGLDLFRVKAIRTKHHLRLVHENGLEEYVGDGEHILSKAINPDVVAFFNAGIGTAIAGEVRDAHAEGRCAILFKQTGVAVVFELGMKHGIAISNRLYFPTAS